jgi:hypothetical protein
MPTFERTAIPVVTLGANPYLNIVKEIIGTDEAITFVEDVEPGTIRKAFDKYKRELQAAGVHNDVTVRSHIYDAASGRKLILPSEKDAVLRLVGEGKETVEKIKAFKVVFWTTDKIVRGSAEEDVDNTEE